MEVIVIGGGPAGSVAARTLAEAGIKTFLIERDLNRAKPCGGGIPSAAFKEFGIPEEIIERKVTKIRLISPSLKELTIPLEYGYLAMVKREVFDTCLRKKAEGAGVEVIDGLFLGLNIGSRVEIEYKYSNTTKRLKADFLIGADGVNSQVARCIGARLSERFIGVQERIKVSQEQMERYGDLAEFWYGSEISPSLYGWVFPKGDHLCIGTAVSPKDSKRLLDYLKRFKERLGKRIEGATTIKREAYPAPLEILEKMVYRKVLLTGDAAGLVLPVSAEGIYYAMKSGEMAAQEIIKKPDHLSGYAERWERLYGKRFRLMKDLQERFYLNDEMRERMVGFHRIKEVQDASMALWLRKDLSSIMLKTYKLLFEIYLSKKF